MYTEAMFIADCSADGARDFYRVGGEQSLPTVDELVAEQAEIWARDEIGAEFGPEVQMRGLRAWAEAWVAAGHRAAEADALRAGDDDDDDDGDDGDDD